MTSRPWDPRIPKDLVRTASVLISASEYARLKGADSGVIYRKHSDHWVGQLRKFLEPPQRLSTLEGIYTVPDVVRLTREDKSVLIEDKHHRVRHMPVKAGARLLRKVKDDVCLPPAVADPDGDLRAGDECWGIFLGYEIDF